MKTIRVSATQARNNFFDLLNQVIYEGAQVIVEKAGTKRNVRFIPDAIKRATTKEDNEERMRILKETFGMWKDVPESRIYDDRFRGKRAKEYLDRVRKGDV